eukprot:TRINITY_DN40503_c0_g2_i2.p1 TRINITY_DN40503_c0_g2~~TRINITY_DN40503_c0_g2_i2.p1  ORF type:complete len:314 (-),score=50.57 TRINITY_DN40503_c0_g2_i2:782-1723(-)
MLVDIGALSCWSPVASPPVTGRCSCAQHRSLLSPARWYPNDLPMHRGAHGSVETRVATLAAAIAAGGVGVRQRKQRQQARQQSRRVTKKLPLRASPQSQVGGLTELPPVPASESPPGSSPFRFSRLANWVAPGHILVGRYPLLKSMEGEGRELLRSLLTDAKVSTFVDLQCEVPPQVDAWPGGRVQANGDTFLQYAKMAKQFAFGRDLHFLHEPCANFRAQCYDDLERLVLNLASRVSEGQVIYVHCRGGRGRSAVVAACLLAYVYKLSAEDAKQRVQHGYDSREYDNSASPESASQRRLIDEFCARNVVGTA